jgi:hypothetical protein
VEGVTVTPNVGREKPKMLNVDVNILIAFVKADHSSIGQISRPKCRINSFEKPTNHFECVLRQRLQIPDVGRVGGVMRTMVHVFPHHRIAKPCVLLSVKDVTVPPWIDINWDGMRVRRIKKCDSVVLLKGEDRPANVALRTISKRFKGLSNNP